MHNKLPSFQGRGRATMCMACLNQFASNWPLLRWWCEPWWINWTVLNDSREKEKWTLLCFWHKQIGSRLSVTNKRGRTVSAGDDVYKASQWNKVFGFSSLNENKSSCCSTNELINGRNYISALNTFFFLMLLTSRKLNSATENMNRFFFDS